ncbi:hypothetical protein D8Y22_21710 [Salinadaptatus halalkaliphilus]|uniref:Uncharacterized protein n=1 Tax=Salinadaptatus halalkaliphilus TaxID=2419781 RepID=A0A4S3TGJ8_9EURY|nr:hypothetical protein [Salinadaptatus halalkaliphilus]THE63059.1 hypothetical protein D8Y22_21710 [Salinadaptatus halalkaliphilus]
MATQVDVQEQTIGAGSILAFALYGYGIFVDEALLGFDARNLGLLAFAGTFAAVALLHGAYGRRDFAVAHAAAGVGLALVAFASSGLQVLGGMVLLVAGGAYIAVTTMRARREANEVAG